MQNSDPSYAILSNLHQPAFLAAEGVVTAVNTGAQQRFVKAGMSTADLIATGKEEYEAFRSGSLYLTICLAGTEYFCNITAIDNGQLFMIEEKSPKAELQALALASQQLNMPVSEICVLVEQLSASSEEKAKINKNLFRLRRILGNMADAARLTVSTPRLSSCEMCALFEEILEKSAALLSQDGIELAYRLPNHYVYSTASEEMLQRAVYNLLSNAAKYARAGSSIEAALTHTEKRLAFSVTSCYSPAFAEGIRFNSYTRQPGLENPQFGLGLGMTLIQAAAAAHGGTVLCEKLPGDKLRITLSLPVRQDTSGDIRSPALIPDIYAGSDQALIELSDVLSYHLYSDI